MCFMMTLNPLCLTLACLAFWLCSFGVRGSIPTAQLCIHYFGDVRADIVPPAISKYNYNGTILCPDDWSFDVPSAIFKICPPWYGDFSTTLDVSLLLGSPGLEVDSSVDALRLDQILITNGSVPGPFENDADPAILAPYKELYDYLGPRWTINGTQAALYKSPDSNHSVQGAWVDCNEPPAKQSDIDQIFDGDYCGGYYDVHHGGCWAYQYFLFSMQRPLNFSIRFDQTGSSVKFSTRQVYPYLNVSTGPKSARETYVHFEFSGDIHRPSVTDYDFWEHAAIDYETVDANDNSIRLSEDSSGMPIFNAHADGNWIWYAAGNRTYSENGAASCIMDARKSREVVVVAAITGIFAEFFSAW